VVSFGSVTVNDGAVVAGLKLTFRSGAPAVTTVTEIGRAGSLKSITMRAGEAGKIEPLGGSVLVTVECASAAAAENALRHMIKARTANEGITYGL